MRVCQFRHFGTSGRLFRIARKAARTLLSKLRVKLTFLFYRAEYACQMAEPRIRIDQNPATFPFFDLAPRLE